ncbi:hypothetical protein P5V15_007036 [Pogonomyrmex californicus]
MASSITTLCNILGIDRVNMDGKMILIKEEHGTNANFLVNAVLSHALKKMDTAICLVLCHNTFGHYHNIGMRFGYNLLDLKEKNRVTVIEPMKIITNDIIDMCKNITNKMETVIPDVTSAEHIDVAYKLFTYVKEKYDEAAKFTKSVVLIIDDINHFFDLGLDVCDIMYFMKYLRSFLALHPSSQLCILIHVFREDLQTSNADIITNALKHSAHLCVTTQPFKTGYSTDSSGKLTVYWKTDSIRSKFHWIEKTTYLFKLSDWQVKIGTSGEEYVL